MSAGAASLAAVSAPPVGSATTLPLAWSSETRGVAASSPGAAIAGLPAPDAIRATATSCDDAELETFLLRA